MKLNNILYEIFIEPIAVLSLRDILLILAFALIVDFFWQFAFRYMVILIARLHETLNYLVFLRNRKKSEQLLREIVFLEKRYNATEKEQRSRQVQILKRLAKAREERRLLEDKIKVSQEAFEPFVSIIIPCHNSEDAIENTLIHVLDLDYARKEIIVVDDGSTDNTYKVASKFQGPVNVIRREQCSGRKTGAVNFGLAFASGEIVVVIDDDTIVDKYSLSALVKPLYPENVAATGGNVKVLLSDKSNLLTKLQSIEYLIIMQLVKPFQAFFYKTVLIISGAYGAFRKNMLERAGAWDVDTITEDLDLTWKLYRLRKRVLHSEGAVCFTEAPSTIRALVKQRNRWDYGLFETLSKHRNLIFSTKFPALGFGLLPESVLFEIISIAARPLYLLLLVLTGRNLLSIALLIFYFYLTLEFLVIFSTGLLSSDKRFCLKAIYAPLMLFYHQFLALIRIRALYRFATKKGIQW